MTCDQVIVWLDETEARIFRMGEELRHVSTVYAPSHDAAERAAAAADELGTFFRRIARALDCADEILIAGPSDTRSKFARYLHRDDRAHDPRVLGVESIPRPSAPLLAGYAKRYFVAGSPRQGGGGSGKHSS